MEQLEVGSVVKSIAGHDFNKFYVIIKLDNEYAYVVDGKIRTFSKIKKKKRKHLENMNYVDFNLVGEFVNHIFIDAHIRKAIKCFIASYNEVCQK